MAQNRENRDTAILLVQSSPEDSAASRKSGGGKKACAGFFTGIVVFLIIVKLFLGLAYFSNSNTQIPDYKLPDRKIPKIPDVEIPGNIPTWAPPPLLPPDSAKIDNNRCTSLACKEATRQLKSYMDESFNPCDDFYKYACQGWIEEHTGKLNPLENSTQALTELDKQNLNLIKRLLENRPSVSFGAETKARDFFNSCINKKKNLKDYIDDLGLKNSSSMDDFDSDDYDKDEDEWGWEHWEKFFPTIREDARPLLEEKDFETLVCTALTVKLFPEVTARLFVYNVFTNYEKDVSNIIELTKMTYQTMIRYIPWMDYKTRTYLDVSFDILEMVVGYPKQIMNISYVDRLYENVTVSKTSYFHNMRSLVPLRSKNPPGAEVENTIQANAFYMPLLDKLFVPVGIAQKPFFDKTFPDVINFAKFSTTVAHELTHALTTYINGIDILGGIIHIPASDMVSTYTIDKYKQLNGCVAKQYSSFEVPLQISKLMVNGSSTSDENVADILGIQIAFRSFMENAAAFSPLPSLEKFSKEQLFFIAAAQNQCESFSNKKTEAGLLKDEVTRGVHSPNFIRVLGQMRNFHEFSKAFNCPVESRYNPVNKCQFFGSSTVIEKLR